MKTNILRRNESDRLCSLCACMEERPVRMQQEGGCLQARKRALSRNDHAATLILDFQALESGENKVLLVKPLS